MGRQKEDNSIAQQAKIVFLSSFTWFFAGFDLLLLPLLGKEIGSAFFPNIDPTQTILAVYGVFSLSLLARVFGGIVFGRIADANGQRPVIIISLLSLTILMFLSAILPGVRDSTVNILFVPVLFTLTRFGIGFFVGALWPTAAIFGMERLHEKGQEKYTVSIHKYNPPSGSEATKCDSKQIVEEGDPKKSTIQSALMQLGFHASVFLSVGLIIILLQVCSSHCDTYFHFTPYFQFKDAFVWRTMCIIGVLLGIICSIIFIKYSRKEIKDVSYDVPPKKGILIALLTDAKYNEYRKTLFNFWLILSGLIYMYYSDIVILPEMFIRDNLLMPLHLGNGIIYPFVIILFVVSTIGAHIWLGFYCRHAWQRGTKFFSLPIKLRYSYWKVSQWLSRLIGIKYSDNYPKLSDDIIEENVDLLVIILVGVLLIIAGTIGVVLFSFSFHSGQDPHIPVIYTLIPVTMIANSGWALIPSMLSSRFPTGLRNTCSTLVYNGGLVIGFASPFIMLELYLSFKSEYVIFFPMILGAFTMIRGAAHFINDRNTQHVKSRGKRWSIAIVNTKYATEQLREIERRRWGSLRYYPYETQEKERKTRRSNPKITLAWIIVWIIVAVIVIFFVLLMPLHGEHVSHKSKNQHYTATIRKNFSEAKIPYRILST